MTYIIHVKQHSIFVNLIYSSCKESLNNMFPVWFPTETPVSLDSGTNINSFTMRSLMLPALSWCCWIMTRCNKNTRVNRKSLCLTLRRSVSGNKNIWLSSFLKYISNNTSLFCLQQAAEEDPRQVQSVCAAPCRKLEENCSSHSAADFFFSAGGCSGSKCNSTLCDF